ncbi:DUF58 domain-containing protein [Wenzhouxiangella limi]|uniref:DUF58 domain-containing protein n=1 Tax=Wenzhouxiangella limi TaxID=2707351 RepID=A0A845V1M9_9GAMM|nr:DUF58 domain-containing protein [Wenzhouxiangella limi]NDY96998.1 DUF58 domain-containing protein [Wenzhouxiangella limi]
MDSARSASGQPSQGLPRRWFNAWIVRRGPTRPPLTLRYRQIFILPTRFGWLLGALMFAMLMGSLNFNNNLGLLTTFIVAGLGSNSMLIAYRNLEGLRILRTGAAPVFAGQSALLLVSLAGNAGRPRPGLEVALDDNEQIVSIPANGVSEVQLPLPTHHRGWLQPGRCRVQTCQPVGLFRAWSWFWPERPILVWPRPATNPPPLPEGGGRREGQLDQPQADGDEFYSLRKWREGDPLHRVAWKASQRHDTLLARELRRPRSRHLALDLAQTPGQDLEQRIGVLTAWVLTAHQQQRAWTLRLGPETLGPGRDDAHLQRCLRALAEFQ